MSGGISVVVPVWNRRDLMERLLRNLEAQTEPAGEVIVVDNGSSDGSAEAAERGGARVLRMEINAGFSRAVNRGIQESRGALVAIVNNDVELAPDWRAGPRRSSMKTCGSRPGACSMRAIAD
jgi:glycosyltransferase involved in cell wall biosynthesis